MTLQTDRPHIPDGQAEPNGGTSRRYRMDRPFIPARHTGRTGTGWTDKLDIGLLPLDRQAGQAVPTVGTGRAYRTERPDIPE